MRIAFALTISAATTLIAPTARTDSFADTPSLVSGVNASDPLETATVMCAPTFPPTRPASAKCSITRVAFQKRRSQQALEGAATLTTLLKKPGARAQYCAPSATMPDVVKAACATGSLDAIAKALNDYTLTQYCAPSATTLDVIKAACTTGNLDAVAKAAREVAAQTCLIVAYSLDRDFEKIDAVTWVSKYSGPCVDDVLTLSKDAESWKLRIARTWTPKPGCNGNTGDVTVTNFARPSNPRELGWLGCKYIE